MTTLQVQTLSEYITDTKILGTIFKLNKLEYGKVIGFLEDTKELNLKEKLKLKCIHLIVGLSKYNQNIDSNLCSFFFSLDGLVEDQNYMSDLLNVYVKNLNNEHLFFMLTNEDLISMGRDIHIKLLNAYVKSDYNPVVLEKINSARLQSLTTNDYIDEVSRQPKKVSNLIGKITMTEFKEILEKNEIDEFDEDTKIYMPLMTREDN